MRKPARWCRRRLAVFSGKIPVWMVQIPSASAEAKLTDPVSHVEVA